jgi:hypothetical protein
MYSFRAFVTNPFVIADVGLVAMHLKNVLLRMFTVTCVVKLL